MKPKPTTNYEIAIHLMEKFPDKMHFCGPCNEMDLLEAERSLSLRMPEIYRRFLHDFGAGSFGSAEFFGVVSKNKNIASIPNTIWLTLKLRKNIRLPHNYVVIAEDGMGGHICLECNNSSKDGAHQVVAYYWSPDQAMNSPVAIADSFADYFLAKVQSVIDDTSTG